MNNIKKIMQLKNISIMQLSKGTNINYPSIHNLVNREDLGMTQLATLNKVAVFLNVSVDKLYTFKDVK